MRIIIKILTLLILAIFVGSITAQRGKGSSTPTDLTGTSWQLVKFQNSDGETVTPDDKSKYTITFGANGHATVRVDCNRGGGPWKYKGTNQIEFGSMNISHAKCGPGSLHDSIVREGAAVRDYSIRNGHLFFSLKDGGAAYELEPLARGKKK